MKDLTNLTFDRFGPAISLISDERETDLASGNSSSLWAETLWATMFSSFLGCNLFCANLAFSRDPKPLAMTLIFLHLSFQMLTTSINQSFNINALAKQFLFQCIWRHSRSLNTEFNNRTTKTSLFTLRSTFERRYRILLNSGSLSIVRHFPAPCLTTPAFRAPSSWLVHFCFGAPIKSSRKKAHAQATSFFHIRKYLLRK